MALTSPRAATAIFGGIVLGIALQFLGCILWHNWWPMLTAFMYVLVPMPALFFGGAPGSSLASSWIDAGKFLTGFSAVGSVAIPAILYHAGKIAGGAFAVQLLAVGVLASTLFAWDYLSEESGGGFYSY